MNICHIDQSPRCTFYSLGKEYSVTSLVQFVAFFIHQTKESTEKKKKEKKKKKKEEADDDDDDDNDDDDD